MATISESQRLKDENGKTNKQIENLKDEKSKLEKENKNTQEIKTKIDELQKQIEALKVSRENKKLLIASAHAEAPKVAPVPPVSVSGGNNETIVWNFLIGQGCSRNQTAGIMGTLQQEHGFQTSGDGLAQWIGGRKARLMSMSDPYSIKTQLRFLIIELNESYIGDAIKSTNDVVSATRIFQNQFERCGDCREHTRIKYANEILGRH